LPFYGGLVDCYCGLVLNLTYVRYRTQGAKQSVKRALVRQERQDEYRDPFSGRQLLYQLPVRVRDCTTLPRPDKA
jgi:hypothetical protein